MIFYLFGKIKLKGKGFVVCQTDNVGYKVFVSAGYYADLNIGDEVELFTYHYIREDAFDLYGFKNVHELEMFELLISISGIGPKSALGVLAVGSINDIKRSILSNNPELLIKVSGIGRKTADRVILELRGKISDKERSGDESAGESGSYGDELDALMSLGYSIQQAREALKNIDPDIKDSSGRIREALKKMKS
jgi:holliday junction DNA helicase RuvA